LKLKNKDKLEKVMYMGGRGMECINYQRKKKMHNKLMGSKIRYKVKIKAKVRQNNTE